MGNQKPLRVKGAAFGPLKVIQLWGPQSGNLAWIYHCRACGYVGKRLGVALRRKAQRCPKCKYSRSRPGRVRWPFPEPDMDAVAALMENAPPFGAGRKLSLSRRLGKCTTTELHDLLDRVEAELERRTACEKSSLSGVCGTETAGAPRMPDAGPAPKPGAIAHAADATSPCERDQDDGPQTAQNAWRS